MTKSKLTKSVVDAYKKRNSNAENRVFEFEQSDIDLMQNALTISKLSGDLLDQVNEALTDPESVDYDNIIAILASLLWNIQSIAHISDTSIEEISEMDIYQSPDKEEECPHCHHCQEDEKKDSNKYEDISFFKDIIEGMMTNDQLRIEIDTTSRVVTVHKISTKK